MGPLAVLLVGAACSDDSDKTPARGLDAAVQAVDAGSLRPDAARPSLDSGVPQLCTAAGCSSGAGLSFAIVETSAEVHTQSVEFCRNATCFAADLSKLSLDDLPPGVGTNVMVPPAEMVDSLQSDSIDVTVWRSLDGGVIDKLDLRYTTYRLADAHDGDRYHGRLVAADGGTLRSFDQSVTYTVLEPNGHACGPTCYEAVLNSSLP